jgi:hypothetical protein
MVFLFVQVLRAGEGKVSGAVGCLVHARERERIVKRK